MKKILFLKAVISFALFAISSQLLYSQKILKPKNEKTYTEYMDKVLQPLRNKDFKEFKNGTLYDRVYSIARLDVFNTNDTINTSNYDHFMRSWGELKTASNNSNFLSTGIIGNIAYSYERKNKIQIGIINTDFTYINPLALSPDNASLKVVNHKIERISKNKIERLNRKRKEPIESTYLDKHLLVISPLNSIAIRTKGKVDFEFGTIFLDNSSKRIKHLSTIFENGKKHEIIKNHKIVNKTISQSFTKNGIHKIKFRAVFSDNTILITNASFLLKLESKNYARMASASNVSSLQEITATKPFLGYEGATSCGDTCYGKGEYKVFYANGNTSIKKPFIIVDGFDPNDLRRIDIPIEEGGQTIYNSVNYKDVNGNSQNLVETLKNNNFDVIILNFPKYKIGSTTVTIYVGPKNVPITIPVDIYRDGGADYIERNGKVLQALIEKIKIELASNGSSDKIKIAGPSMGALIVQYALADMEQNNEDHYTDLFISFDGPHKGANASIGMQKALQYFATGSGLVENFINDPANQALSALNSPAAKQMLIHHYLSDTSGVPQGAPNYRNRFQNVLNSLGFPSQCRNIALINGSVLGHKTGQVGTNMLNAQIDAILGGFIQRRLWINYTSNSGQKEVFRFLKKNWWGLHTQADIKKYSTTSSNYGSLDNAPGGFLNIKGRTEEALGGQFPYYFFNGFTNTEIYSQELSTFARIGITTASLLLGNVYASVDLQDNTAFVPTKSALAFSGINTKWDEQIGCRNLVCTNETPFDSYYAPQENQEHASMHLEGVNWMLDELNGIEKIPSVYGGCNTTNIVINGNDRLCSNQIATYTINNCNSSSVNWSTSNNLQIISSNNQQITVKNTNVNITSSWVRASLSNGQVVSKTILGKPSVSYTIDPGSSPGISLYGVGTSIYQQGIYNTQWIKTEGTGQIYNTNSFSTYATGTGNNWYVKGNIKVTNSCGTTIKSFYIRPKATDPCEAVRFEKVTKNKYRVVQPCQQKLKSNNSIDIELYDLYGVKKNISLKQDIIDLSKNARGTIRILKANVKGEVVSKMIIID